MPPADSQVIATTGWTSVGTVTLDSWSRKPIPGPPPNCSQVMAQPRGKNDLPRAGCGGPRREATGLGWGRPAFTESEGKELRGGRPRAAGEVTFAHILS